MNSIIHTATDAGKFTTLLSALKAASFTDTLRTTGPYTVFAPTDEAFKRLAPGELDALMKDTDRLYRVLAHHVVRCVVTAAELTSGNMETMAGTSLTASRRGGDVFVNGVKIIQADIAAENGVIHMVHEVILPLGTVLAAA